MDNPDTSTSNQIHLGGQESKCTNRGDVQDYSEPTEINKKCEHPTISPGSNEQGEDSGS